MALISEIALEFCGRGGKRLRPRLCKAAYIAAGGDPSSPKIDAICEAVECFHKASLIHDDIQDCDEERYGRPTVWKEYDPGIAIAAGDWLVAHGYELIVNSGFPAAIDMMKATVHSHVALCEGQGDDLIGTVGAADGDYVSVCERKTGEAFAIAAQLGAL
ncbi:MAG: polyprenyl synthetase family protein, partial [Kiritimatiellae bacterium]|nr:polyprenyl synthetase family protein [Kiritimatiellia bacterium]